MQQHGRNISRERGSNAQRYSRPQNGPRQPPNRPRDQGSNAERNSRQQNGPRYQDSPEFDKMMLTYRKFFNQRIFNKPDHLELADEEFQALLTEILESAPANNEQRHQFLIQLCRKNVLEMGAPICTTIMVYVGGRNSTGNSRKFDAMVDNLKKLITLLKEILIRIPHYQNVHASCNAINALMEAIPGIKYILSEQFKEMEELLLDPNLLMNNVNNTEKTWSASLSFINEPIIPDLEVILKGSLDTKYQNIMKGPYESPAHYLETWFKLMQEDFISPVRTAIKDFKQERHLKPESNQMRLDGGYYYQFERILETEYENGMLLHQLKFNLENLKHVDWSASDRLRSESLIFLSNDNFKTAYCATIQKLRELPQKLGTVWVTMMDGKSPPRGGFDGIEAMPFFLPYECVLQRLKYIASLVHEKRDLPMQRYIVGSQKRVEAPSYIRPTTRLEMSNGTVIRAGKIKTANLSLDSSQTEAMELALTHELAIIQGPPGCGKSYVGAILVDILMQNKPIWQRYGHGCMMLMAYTNHAIDQFITECEERGIDMSKTVRLGGRGNEQMEKYTLYKRRQELCQWFEYKNIIIESRSLQSRILLKDQHINHIQKVINMNYEVFSYEDLSSYIAAPFTDQILMVYGEVNTYVIFEWLKEHLRGKLDFTKSRIITEDEAMQLQNVDIFSLPHINRICLFKFWCECAKYQAHKYIGPLKRERERLKVDYEVIRRQQDIAVVRRCNIIAMTTTGASKHSHLVEAVKPTIVLVEEAAEVIESHVVAPLTTGCKHLILIGDHQQLRPSIAEFQLEKRNMAISMFERLIMNDIPNRRLDTQHRMHPDIAHILVPHIYPTLNHHPHVYTYPEVKGIPKRMVFLTHEQMEHQTGEKSSKINDFEAKFLVYLARYLLLQGYGPDDVTILTTYTGQLRQVKKHIDQVCTKHPDPIFTTAERMALLEEKFKDLAIVDKTASSRKNPVMDKRRKEYEKEKEDISTERSKLRDVRVTTVDNYQGEESKIILLSFVRSNARGDIGFLKWSNRICVALSRAKHGFYAVGNFKLFEKNRKSDLWNKLCKQLVENENLKETIPIVCQKHNTERHAATGEDFQMLAPEGGCPKVCGQSLSCSHKCTRKCHPLDPFHMTFKCQVPCPGELSCAHKCLRECVKPGDNESFFFVSKHPNALYRNCLKCAKKIYCDLQVDVPYLKCGHKGISDCSEVCNYICQEKRSFDLTCGHQKTAPCDSDPVKLTRACRKMVTETLPCNHEARRPCNMPRQPCQEKVNKTFPVCGHSVMAACSESITELNCMTIVDKLMQCGHTLEVQCYKSKTLQMCPVEIDVTLSCGHEQRVSCHEGTNALCETDVMKTFPCNHIVIVKCSQATTRQKCLQEVTIKAKCKIHEVRTKCCERIEKQSQPCDIEVTSKLTCGHNQRRLCHESIKPCMEEDKKNRSKCQHFVRATCYKLEAEMKTKCAIRVGLKRACGHFVHVPCHQQKYSNTNATQCRECEETDSDSDESEDDKKLRKALGLSRKQGNRQGAMLA